MTGGADGRNNDPEGADGAKDEWWQGAPQPGSPWESQPQHPVQQPPGAADPTTQQPFPAAGANPYQSGPNPYQSGPAPQQPPYQTGPVGQSGQHPHQTGPNPFQSGPQPLGGQQPYGGYPTPSPGSRGRVWLYSGIGAAVVVVVAVVATFFVINDDSGGSIDASGTTTVTATPSGTTTTTTTSKSATATTSRPATPGAEIAGYQVVVPPGIDVAWDMPADWSMDQSVTTIGSGSDQIAVAGLASEGKNYCTDHTRSDMFAALIPQGLPGAVATDIGARTARIGWNNPASLNATSPEPFDTTGEVMRGFYVETTGAFTASDPRCAKSFTVYTLAIGMGTPGVLVVTLTTETGVDRSVDRDTARRILASVRLI